MVGVGGRGGIEQTVYMGVGIERSVCIRGEWY